MDKEIHFYESLNVIPENQRVFYDWQSAIDAIEEMCLDNIHTTQMCLLSTSLIIKGYRVFVHQGNGVTYELHLRDNEHQGDHTLRLSQNMYGMWASNVFRISRTVNDYIKATQQWNVEGLKYEIDGILFDNAKIIPTDLKGKSAESYKFDSNALLVALTTAIEGGENYYEN
jgi:hypothetical protein